MTALYDRITAALDDWDDYEHEGEAGKRRVAADRRVLARHAPVGDGHSCAWCPPREQGALRDRWPCPDVLDLAARYDVQVTP